MDIPDHILAEMARQLYAWRLGGDHNLGGWEHESPQTHWLYKDFIRETIRILAQRGYVVTATHQAPSQDVVD